MRIAICDDDKADLHALQKAVSIFDQCGTLDICAFSSAAELYKSEMAQNFHIAILDIEMPPPNGYDIAKRLVETGSAPIIIFLLSAYEVSIEMYLQSLPLTSLNLPLTQKKLNLRI